MFACAHHFFFIHFREIFRSTIFLRKFSGISCGVDRRRKIFAQTNKSSAPREARTARTAHLPRTYTHILRIAYIMKHFLRLEIKKKKNRFKQSKVPHAYDTRRQNMLLCTKYIFATKSYLTAPEKCARDSC